VNYSFKTYQLHTEEYLEKLIVDQLIKIFPASYVIPKVHYRVHKSPPLEHILSQLNLIHTLAPCFLKIRFNIVLPSTPMPAKH